MKLKNMKVVSIVMACLLTVGTWGSTNLMCYAQEETTVTEDTEIVDVTTDEKGTVDFSISADAVFTFSDTHVTTEAVEVGCSVSGTSLMIEEPGTYVVRGSCTDGSIEVEKSVTGVTLVLEDLSLKSEKTAPLVMDKESAVELIVQGENTLSDTEYNNDENYVDNTVAENAVIKAKADSSLVIDGTGILNVNGNGKNAIKAKGALEVKGGNLNLTAVNDGLTGESDFLISGGVIDITTTGDGIQGDVNVDIIGGDITINSQDDGIKAEYVLTIGTEGGSDDDLNINIEYSVEGLEGATVNMHSGTTKVMATDDGVNAANSDLTDYSYELNVTGGYHYISCSAGDGFDSNGSLSFTGGKTIVLAACGDGEGDPLDCETTLTIKEGTVVGIGLNSGMMRLPSDCTYVQFGAGGQMGGGNFGGDFGGNQGRPDMGNRPEMPEVSGGAVMPEPPTTSGEAVIPEPPTTSGEAVMPEPPTTSGEAVMPQMPGTTGGNATFSIKNGDVVTITDENNNELILFTAEWIGNADMCNASYVFYTDGTLTEESVLNLIVNEEQVANSAEGNGNSTPPAGQFEIGDANMSGIIDLEDANLVLRIALGITTIENGMLADMDGNQVIELEDARLVLRRALGISVTAE